MNAICNAVTFTVIKLKLLLLFVCLFVRMFEWRKGAVPSKVIHCIHFLFLWTCAEKHTALTLFFFVFVCFYLQYCCYCCWYMTGFSCSSFYFHLLLLRRFQSDLKMDVAMANNREIVLRNSRVDGQYSENVAIKNVISTVNSKINTHLLTLKFIKIHFSFKFKNRPHEMYNCSCVFCLISSSWALVRNS